MSEVARGLHASVQEFFMTYFMTFFMTISRYNEAHFSGTGSTDRVKRVQTRLQSPAYTGKIMPATAALGGGFNNRVSFPFRTLFHNPFHNSFKRTVRATPPELRKQERQRIEETENTPG